MSPTLSLRPSAVALLLAVVLVCMCLVAPVTADDGGLAVQVGPGLTRCFYEQAPAPGVKMFLHYMVNSGGSLDVDCHITGPDNKLIWNADRDTENRVLFKSRAAGMHSFCFLNHMSTVTAKVVSFSVMVGDGEVGSAGDGATSPKKDSLYRSIRRLQEGLGEIEELQQRLKAREHDHRATTEVANTRVVVFCIIEIAFIAGMGVGSVIYLRNLFVTKRMV